MRDSNHQRGTGAQVQKRENTEHNNATPNGAPAHIRIPPARTQTTQTTPCTGLTEQATAGALAPADTHDGSIHHEQTDITCLASTGGYLAITGGSWELRGSTATPSLLTYPAMSHVET